MAAAAASTLVLSSEEATVTKAVIDQIGAACDKGSFSQFTSNPQSFSSPKERVVLSISSNEKDASAAAAGSLLSLLSADGLLIVFVDGPDAAETLRALERSFLYAGFISHSNDELPPEISKVVGQHPGIHLGAWKRPKWAIGASSALGGEAANLVDEDALIDSAEAYKPIGKGRSDCAARPRACANCTCGRKEQEEAAEKETFKKQLETGAVRSSCGNCYLGDAFRCAGCPYKGLPAFRPGEKVDLSEEAERASAAAAAAAALIGAVSDAATAGEQQQKKEEQQQEKGTAVVHAECRFALSGATGVCELSCIPLETFKKLHRRLPNKLHAFFFSSGNASKEKCWR
ncbi:hypothetical protein Emed_003966 [Eimeria media]